MKIPEIFIPDKNLEQKTEELIKDSTKILSLKDLIHEGVDTIGYRGGETKCIFNVIFKLNNGTKVSLHYTPEPFYEKNLTLIEGSNLGLESVEIESMIKKPIETIQHTFSENPFNYKELPFQHTEFELEDRIIPKVRKRIFKKNKPIILYGDGLVIDRMAFESEDQGESYKINTGHFYRIVRSKNVGVKKCLKDRVLEALRDKILGGKLCFHTMSIYQVLPFTEKEEELLSSLKKFKAAYRFPRPKSDEKDSKHLFDFEIEKKEDEYEVFIRISDGFASGLDIKSIWQAENLFDYLKVTKPINYYTIEVYKKSTQHQGPITRIF